MANTCANLANKTIKIPDNCGKLTPNDYINNWLSVRAIIQWIQGFFGFKIPGRLQKQVFTVSGVDNITISNIDWSDSKVYTLPTGNFAYAFYQVFINGLERPGGTVDGGPNAFTLEYAWQVETNEDGEYVLTFLDEDLNPIALGSEGKPETVTVYFRPNLTVGTDFCTTNGSENQSVGSCKC